MGADLMPFADNWAYLKTELAWLDRLLMLAIARQRKDTKAVNQVAKNPTDRLSAHWWKGVISVPNPSYDDCRVPTKPAKTETTTANAQTGNSPSAAQCKAPVGYQNQLEHRIKASAQADIVLALPSLRHYLNLTLFEKNLILMVLAPEINRRYGRLYHFLQTGEEKNNRPSDLPMVDLALRLLCRNDLERRRAREKLTGPHSLIEKKVLRYISLRPSTRLTNYLQLSEDWTDYLLSEKPDQQFLFGRLATPAAPLLALPAPTPATRAVKISQPAVPWDQLILPTPVMGQLQSITQQTSAILLTRAKIGQVAMLVGEAGTGKTMAAGAIATSSRQPLSTLDLSQVNPRDWAAVLNSLDPYRYPVLLIKSASIWFGRNRNAASGEAAELSTAQLQQWLQTRKSEPGLTLLSSRYLHVVQAKWRQQMDAILSLPMPYKVARKMMWRQAFAGISCSDTIDWSSLAAQLKVSGGEIQVLAEAAIAIAQSKKAKTMTIGHIQQAIKQRGLSVTLS
ncbi:MAG: AAA family ATPase [Cyanobacteria bacterium P01_D01_bin.36]